MKVLVTGGTGFVAMHVIDQLLAEGHQVRATVRSLGDETKLAPLRRLQDGRSGTLELVAADLTVPDAFTEPMAGCEIVFHIASPFLMPEQITDGQRQVIEPAQVGMQSVLDAIEVTPSVTRLVLTSTVGAIFGHYRDVEQMDGGVLSEAYFNTSSTPEHDPYHYSKTLTEQMAWSACQAQERWSMVAINPGLILGPSLSPQSASGSLFLMDELMGGKLFFGAPNFSFTVVDVRDVATAHLRAAFDSSTSGRYILARKEMVSFLEMGRIVRKAHPRRLLIPRHPVPDGVVRKIGRFFGLSDDYIHNHLGVRFTVDNHRSVEELKINYRSVEETMLDHFDAWQAAR